MNESTAYFIRALGLFMIILIIVFILAVVTPKLAKYFDKLAEKLFKNKSNNNNDDSIYKVRSIYDIPKNVKSDESKSEENYINDGESENGEK